MRILTKVCGMLLACAGSGALAQADAAALAKKFGALETVAQASLSPDGGKVAFTSEATIGTVVYVADLDAGGKLTRVMSLARSSGRITRCAPMPSSSAAAPAARSRRPSSRAPD